MVFSSPVFLYLFLPLVLLAYFVMPRWGRNGLLVAGSLLFYAWGEGAYLALLGASVIFNYAMGLGIGRAESGKQAWLLGVGVVWNLAPLLFFKYMGTWGAALGMPGVEVALPLGISFFTFQAIAYLVDVKRGQVAATRNVLDFALYLSFFPQLVAGPIVRYEAIRERLRERRVELDGVVSGIELFVCGLSKKLLLANPLGRVADAGFGEAVSGIGGTGMWLGVMCYTLQLYFDFSGYTEMARGLGRIFGFELPENFRFPYLSGSVREFWRRWHITLSSWFRDYVFIPLGGSRGAAWRTWLNLWLVFGLCGIWHGASVTFLLWGLAHGGWIALERIGLGRLWERLPRVFGWAVTLCFVMTAWTLFRAESWEQWVAVSQAMWGVGGDSGTGNEVVYGLMDTRVWLMLCVAWVVALDGFGWAARRVVNWEIGGFVWMGRFVGMVVLGGLCFVQLSGDGYDPFLYFHF